jgi:ferredoxin
MRSYERMEIVTLKNIDPNDRRSLLDMINDKIRGAVNEKGEPMYEIPCQCRAGICGTCMITVKEGEFKMTDGAFKEICIDENETLPCATKVLSDSITVELRM